MCTTASRKRSKEYIPTEVSSSPSGDDQTSRNGYGALRGMEALGSRMKNSRSLQNLEAATFDSLRNAVVRVEGLGDNIKQRYGSQLDMACGKYEHLDEEGGRQGLRWR